MRNQIRIALILSVFPITTSGQDTRSREPRQPLREVHSFVDYAPLRSFQELCEKSDVIIEGVAETSAARMISGRVETDVPIGITRVLKGASEMRRVVVAEDGGTLGDLREITEYPLMRPGERYILFLWKDTRSGIPPIVSIPRYRIYNMPFGKYPIERGKIQVANGFFAKYDGTAVDAFSAEITARLKP